MKFTFEADLDYQRDAIDAVTGLFKGEDALTSQFTVLAHPAARAGFEELSDAGVGNRLRLDRESLLANLHAVQERSGLASERSLESMNFTVDMETGTGKTYVYLRTLYELHQLYGFTKFVVVVPSVAIKEGVLASLAMLRDHLGSLYGNPPMQYFAYDGGNPSRVRSFATSSGIEIMVVTIAAINKPTNKVYKTSENLDGEVPVDLIRETRPIVVVDEPQSVYGDDGSSRKKQGAGRVAIDRLDPLAVVRYSATHAKFDRANLVYRLDAISAYEKELVKQIEVDSLITESSGTMPYVQLQSVKRTAGRFTARVEVDVEQANRIRRTVKTVGDGTNLADITGRSLYGNLTVSALGVDPEHIRFDTVAETLRPGESIGAEVALGERARQMIAQTIRQHLRKEQEFAIVGREIKVLSLLFVDSVAKYRVYDENGAAQPGEHAQMFEEEYARIAREPEFRSLLGPDLADATAAGAHQGYFSVDRNRKTGATHFVETKESTDAGRQQAGRAYEQIMRDKVGLTTPGTPIRFIFSHSALQEGWDNPNVFQVCVLRNMGSERWRRQSIGRGLRLCVSGSGERVRGFQTNRLTVIANESYEEFAKKLQQELADDLGIEFGKVTVDGFARLQYTPVDGDGVPQHVGPATAQALFTSMIAAGYIDAAGKVQDPLREAVEGDTDMLKAAVAQVMPDESAALKVLGLIKRLAKPLDIRRAGDRVPVTLVDEALQSPLFRALWDRISRRTEYRVQVDEGELRATLVDDLRQMNPVPERKGEWTTSRVERIDQSGITAEVGAVRRAEVAYADSDDLPDILSVMADRTQLIRATLAHALTESGTLPQFRRNPQAYVDQVARRLNAVKERLLIGGLKYDLVADSRPEVERRYPLTILAEADLHGYEGRSGNMVLNADGTAKSFATKSPYEHVVVDSASVEARFAVDLLDREYVKTFVKLPASFTVPTPFGTYNPDWAVMAQRGDGSGYLVLETKSDPNTTLLRSGEAGKTDAARVHFRAVASQAGYDDLRYQVVATIRDVDGVVDDMLSETAER